MTEEKSLRDRLCPELPKWYGVVRRINRGQLDVPKDELLKAKTTIDEYTANVRTMILDASARASAFGEYLAPEHFAEMLEIRKSCSKLSQLLAVAIMEAKEKEKQMNIAKTKTQKTSFAGAFIKIAKRTLSKDVFAQICDEARVESGELGE